MCLFCFVLLSKKQMHFECTPRCCSDTIYFTNTQRNKKEPVWIFVIFEINVIIKSYIFGNIFDMLASSQVVGFICFSSYFSYLSIAIHDALLDDVLTKKYSNRCFWKCWHNFCCYVVESLNITLNPQLQHSVKSE